MDISKKCYLYTLPLCFILMLGCAGTEVLNPVTTNNIAIKRGDIVAVQKYIKSGNAINALDKYDEAIHSTAFLYKLAANYYMNNGNIKKAIEHYRIASNFFKKSSAIYKAKSDEQAWKETKLKLLSGLSVGVVCISAQTQAKMNTVPTPSGKMIGIGDAPYQIADTSNIKTVKEYYVVLSKKSEQFSRECDDIVKLHSNTISE